MVVEYGLVASEGAGAGAVDRYCGGDLKTIITCRRMVWQLVLWEEVEVQRPSEIFLTFWDANGEGAPSGRNSMRLR